MQAMPRRYRTPRLAACAIGAGTGLILVVLSFMPGAPIYPSGLVIVLFISVFPLFGWAVIERSLGQPRRRRRWNDLPGMTNADFNRSWQNVFDFAKRYRILLMIAVPVVIGLWATMMSTMPTLRGQPEHDQAGYYLNDHGTRIPVSRAGYERAVADQDRLFASGATMFIIIAGLLTAYTPRPRRPDALPPT